MLSCICVYLVFLSVWFLFQGTHSWTFNYNHMISETVRFYLVKVITTGKKRIQNSKEIIMYLSAFLWNDAPVYAEYSLT